jgi:hypothetical protein
VKVREKMADKLNKNQVALTLGIFAALVHLVWSIAVAIGIQTYIDWVLLLHSIKLDLILTNVVILNVIMLLVLAFIGGYIIGYVFAVLYNYIGKKVK